MSKTNVRLPKHITPQKYKLRIQPDMEAFSFAGSETIFVTLTQADKKIILHSKDLEITDGWFQIGKDRIEIAKIAYQEKNETVTINFRKVLPKGKGRLYLEFRGVIAESLRGFYKSQYQHLGETKHIVTTQFESTDARRAFPCFDEPAQKAIFELSLIVPKHLHAISNTIETGTPQGVKHDPGLKVVNFKPSPKMSTYLLAYIIGEFDIAETKTKDGVKIRAYVLKGKKKQTKFALDVAKRSLEFMNEYFGVKYPLPILDLISIPDFSAAAMENWGAVTFRESALLVDEDHTAFANRQRIAEVIVHELVHQWFGNLVTMEWWTYLWLNESFATFMANLVVAELFPEWKYWTRFVLTAHAHALELDSLKNTHPIEVEVHHPDQISEIFDAISYSKGASVLRMLHNYLGAEDFRDGLRLYLKKHSYKNTSSIHLWEAFEKVSKKPVRKFMHTWVSKDGYPLIKIAETKPGQLQVEQARFTLNKSSDKTSWPIPLQLQLGTKKLSKIDVFSTLRKKFTVDEQTHFLKTNPNETGFYRTLYSPSLLAKLYEPIKTKELGTIDRFGIIRDLGALVKSGHLSTSVFLEFVQAFENEESYIIWAEISGTLQEIYNIAQDYPKLQEQLASYYLKLLKPTLKLVGWTPQHKESNSRGMLRSLILAQAIRYGDKAIQAKAISLFKQRNRKPIAPDLRGTIYSAVTKQGNNKTFEELKTMYTTAHMQEEQRRVGGALVNFDDPKIYQKVLDMLLSKSVRPSDATILIYWAFANDKNRKIAWSWLKTNWTRINEIYRKDHLLLFAIEGAGHFSSHKKAKEISAFFKKFPAPSGQRTVKQVLEKITAQANWIDRDRADITNCLKRLNSL